MKIFSSSKLYKKSLGNMMCQQMIFILQVFHTICIYMGSVQTPDSLQCVSTVCFTRWTLWWTFKKDLLSQMIFILQIFHTICIYMGSCQTPDSLQCVCPQNVSQGGPYGEPLRKFCYPFCTDMVFSSVY